MAVSTPIATTFAPHYSRLLARLAMTNRISLGSLTARRRYLTVFFSSHFLPDPHPLDPRANRQPITNAIPLYSALRSWTT